MIPLFGAEDTTDGSVTRTRHRPIRLRAPSEVRGELPALSPLATPPGTDHTDVVADRFTRGPRRKGRTMRRIKATLALVGTAGLLGAALHGLGPATANASSHREAPLVAADPAIDN